MHAKGQSGPHNERISLDFGAESSGMESIRLGPKSGVPPEFGRDMSERNWDHFQSYSGYHPQKALLALPGPLGPLFQIPRTKS